MTERVHFFPPEQYQSTVLSAFDAHRLWLTQLLPEAAVHHVGSSAIPGAWSKGDLDILVRVPSSDFKRCDKRLADVLERHLGNPLDAHYASFKNDTLSPPLGVQLVVTGSIYDDFLRFKDRLAQDPECLCAYNALKHRHEGGCMTAYRLDKSAFIESVLATGTSTPFPPPLGGH